MRLSLLSSTVPMAMLGMFNVQVVDFSCFSKSDKFRTVTTSDIMVFPAIEMGLGARNPH